MIVSEQAREVREKGKLPCSYFRKSMNSNFTLFQFCKCRMDKRCSGIRGRPRQNDELKCRTCPSKQTERVEKCQSFEGIEKFGYLGHAKGARGGVIYSVSGRTRLTSTDLPFGAESRLHFTCVRSVRLYGSETWPVQGDNMIRLERHDTRIVR